MAPWLQQSDFHIFRLNHLTYEMEKKTLSLVLLRWEHLFEHFCRFNFLLLSMLSSGQLSSNSQQNKPAGGGRARALYTFSSNCNEELSLQVVICSFHKCILYHLRTILWLNLHHFLCHRLGILLAIWSPLMKNGTWVNWGGNGASSLKTMCRY